MVFHAIICKLGDMPASEMAETKRFNMIPKDLIYPEITSVLLQYLPDRKKICGFKDWREFFFQGEYHDPLLIMKIGCFWKKAAPITGLLMTFSSPHTEYSLKRIFFGKEVADTAALRKK